MLFSLDEVDATWHPLFSEHLNLINKILSTVGDDISPNRVDIFRAFKRPLDEIKVLIVGQDPYPGQGVADGLAFSSRQGQPIPASLRNIFKEYVDDLSLPTPTEPDLTQWSNEGVLLLNRSLTTSVGERNVHVASGWQVLTEAVAVELAKRGVVAILWGNFARTFAPLFSDVIESPHPSPLSARRGFFGSKPFTRTNQLLLAQGKTPVNWQL
jgi:uracil-DNA glycosylase